MIVLCSFLSHSARIWTLDFRIMSWAVYHCATCGTTNDVTYIGIRLFFHFQVFDITRQLPEWITDNFSACIYKDIPYSTALFGFKSFTQHKVAKNTRKAWAKWVQLSTSSFFYSDPNNHAVSHYGWDCFYFLNRKCSLEKLARLKNIYHFSGTYNVISLNPDGSKESILILGLLDHCTTTMAVGAQT